MSTKELQQELSALVDKFNQALADAEAFATEHKLSFHIEPSYGMGGTFKGREVGELGEWGETSDGWYASSQSC